MGPLTGRAEPAGAAARRLLNPPSKKEADRRAYIRAWLDSIGVPESSIRAEYHTKAGPIDLYLTNRRVIIEVKQSGASTAARTGPAPDPRRTRRPLSSWTGTCGQSA